jgi:predicted nucleic acid-binding protein
MIFVDTSAIYALLDRADEHHSRAKETWFYLLESGEQMVTTNYVVVECCALAQHRLGLKAVRSVQDDILPVLNLHWIDKLAHAKAMTALLTANRAKLSLVDCSSFVVMRDLELRVAFAFDRHFDQEDFDFPKLN